jgi:ATP-binding protein involved in chromosome partitioning
MFERSSVPVLGGVENMATMSCPSCACAIDLFPAVADDRSLWATGPEQLASIPFDPVVSATGDSGRPLLLSHPDSAGAASSRSLADALLARVSV